MFRKIREIFSKAIDKISEKMEKISEERFGKEISQEDISKLSEELIIDLVEADVAYEVAENIIKDLEKKIVGSKIGLFEDKKRFIKDKFREILIEYLKRGEWNKDLVEMIKNSSKPYKILFMGVNGVGKTTTIAKVAKYLRDRGLKVLVVAADTFRAGAQEQLEIHCKKLSIPIFRGRYGYDPAALVFDSIKYAQKNSFDVILIDSAGRQHTDIDLMNEIKKISRVSSPDLKILVLDALTGNDAVNQAIEFDKYIGVDGVILTKLDADASGGSALSIITTINKPIIFVGVGQKYDDLISYKADLIIEKIIE
ncbi:MAG: signal recognition particle-docking protein FtsY [Desulfurococcales archaeon]|jgi:fused signal recognition particle receptor|nr:signal recognition particle-docking protein FtsY [Desulfurococcales archaeon]